MPVYPVYPKTIESTYKNIHATTGRAGHFFDCNAKRFFNSRTCSGYMVWRDSEEASTTFFVTSEQFEDGRGYTAPRLYTIRRMTPDGEICTWPDHETGFQAYATLYAANCAAKRTAEEEAARLASEEAPATEEAPVELPRWPDPESYQNTTV